MPLRKAAEGNPGRPTRNTFWSDTQDLNKAECGYSFIEVNDSASSEVPRQGIVSSSGKTLQLDLSRVKVKLTLNDIFQIRSTYQDENYSLERSSNDRNRKGVFQGKATINTTLVLVNGTQVNFEYAKTVDTKTSYLDDSHSRITETQITSFLAHMPVGELAYEKTITYLENGKTKIRLTINREVVFEQ